MLTRNWHYNNNVTADNCEVICGYELHRWLSIFYLKKLSLISIYKIILTSCLIKIFIFTVLAS